MSDPKTVWLLTLTYKYGTEHTLYATKADAEYATDCYVRDYWESEFDEDPRPADPAEARAAYFEASEDFIDIVELRLP